MKLIEKTTLYYLIYTLFIFASGTLLFYFLIRNVIHDGIDEALHQEKRQLIDNFKYESNFEFLEPSENIQILQVHSKRVLPDHYATISLPDSSGAKVHYRQLTCVYQHGEKYYKIIIRQSLSEAEDLIESLLPVEVVLFLILLAGVLMLSRQVSKKLWKPFYDLLEKLRNFNLTQSEIIPATASNIDEFDALGQDIEKMTKKIKDDFINQREFYENSSHELQTPLAIIRNKLELLIQSKNMDENDLEIIQSIFDAVKRLNLLNKGLILLAKIDNDQYHDTEEIHLEVLLKRIVANFKEMMDEMEISFTMEIEEECVVRANPTLIEILLNNLISNSLKHNWKKGELHLQLGERSFSISNSGNELMGNASLMFERFRKESASENSVGLGLSIVKKICDLFNFNVNYTYAESMHRIVIKF